VVTPPSGPTIDAPYQSTEEVGDPVEITCPACGGVLRMSEDESPRFRCSVGHSYGIESLMVNQGEALELSLWTALRALEERATLLDRIASRFAKRGHNRQSKRYIEDRDLTRRRADVVRRAILSGELVEGEMPIIASPADERDEEVPG
jgi:two-component system chemotaxis response regulator CheB